MVDFTVAICTYNGEKRLPILLERLRSQCKTHAFSWDILIVDNNSSDGTAQLIHQYYAHWPVEFPLRYCFEPKQGVAFARRRAIQETDSPLIGFLDDDTLPDENWVSAAHEFAQEHPEAGAWGGQIRADYEVYPPPNFHRIAACLAIIERGENPFQYSPKRGVLPAGAGMVIRRRIWLAHVPKSPLLSGVCAGSLAEKGEDVETLSYIRKAGWPIWYAPKLQLSHHMPKGRLEKPYLIRLFHGIGLSRYPIRMLNHRPWQRPFVMPAYLLNDLRKLMAHIIKYREEIKNNDLVAICEMELFKSSVLSPFDYFKKCYLDRKIQDTIGTSGEAFTQKRSVKWPSPPRNLPEEEVS